MDIIEEVGAFLAFDQGKSLVPMESRIGTACKLLARLKVALVESETRNELLKALSDEQREQIRELEDEILECEKFIEGLQKEVEVLEKCTVDSAEQGSLPEG